MQTNTKSNTGHHQHRYNVTKNKRYATPADSDKTAPNPAKELRFTVEMIIVPTLYIKVVYILKSTPNYLLCGRSMPAAPSGETGSKFKQRARPPGSQPIASAETGSGCCKQENICLRKVLYIQKDITSH